MKFEYFTKCNLFPGLLELSIRILVYLVVHCWKQEVSFERIVLIRLIGNPRGCSWYLLVSLVDKTRKSLVKVLTK